MGLCLLQGPRGGPPPGPGQPPGPPPRDICWMFGSSQVQLCPVVTPKDAPDVVTCFLGSKIAPRCASLTQCDLAVLQCT